MVAVLSLGLDGPKDDYGEIKIEGPIARIKHKRVTMRLMDGIQLGRDGYERGGHLIFRCHLTIELQLEDAVNKRMDS